MKKMIHALKGMSLSMDAIRLSAITLDMETDILQNQPLSFDSVAFLEKTFYESMAYLKTVVKET